MTWRSEKLHHVIKTNPCQSAMLSRKVIHTLPFKFRTHSFEIFGLARLTERMAKKGSR